MVLTLYKWNASPPARSAMMVIEYLKLKDVNFVDVNFLKGENLREDFKKINPQHTVPTLVDDDFVVWDSHAIAVYLLTKYGNNALYPVDIKKRAIVDQRLHFNSGVVFPSMRVFTVGILIKGGRQFTPESLENLDKVCGITESFLDKAWIAGDDFTVADICLGANFTTMDALRSIDATKYPKLRAWMKKCSGLEVFKKINEPYCAEIPNILKSVVAAASK